MPPLLEEKEQIMDIKKILSSTDHTLLSPTATWEEIRKILDDGGNTTLYHYTKPEKLLGILESGTVRFSNALYLNDKEEVTFGVIVDDVEGVTQLKNVPSDVGTYGTLSERKDFIKAVGRNGDDFVLVLDIKNIYTSIEKEIIQSKN